MRGKAGLSVLGLMLILSFASLTAAQTYSGFYVEKRYDGFYNNVHVAVQCMATQTQIAPNQVIEFTVAVFNCSNNDSERVSVAVNGIVAQIIDHDDLYILNLFMTVKRGEIAIVTFSIGNYTAITLYYPAAASTPPTYIPPSIQPPAQPAEPTVEVGELMDKIKTEITKAESIISALGVCMFGIFFSFVVKNRTKMMRFRNAVNVTIYAISVAVLMIAIIYIFNNTVTLIRVGTSQQVLVQNMGEYNLFLVKTIVALLFALVFWVTYMAAWIIMKLDNIYVIHAFSPLDRYIILEFACIYPIYKAGERIMCIAPQDRGEWRRLFGRHIRLQKLMEHAFRDEHGEVLVDIRPMNVALDNGNKIEIAGREYRCIWLDDYYYKNNLGEEIPLFGEEPHVPKEEQKKIEASKEQEGFWARLFRRKPFLVEAKLLFSNFSYPNNRLGEDVDMVFKQRREILALRKSLETFRTLTHTSASSISVEQCRRHFNIKPSDKLSSTVAEDINMLQSTVVKGTAGDLPLKQPTPVPQGGSE